MAIATTGKDVLAKFFDEGAYSALYADGAVTAAFGRANGTPVYAVCQTGAAVAEKDTEGGHHGGLPDSLLPGL